MYICICAWVVPKARDRTIPHSPHNQPPQFGDPNQRWLGFAPFSTRITRLLSSCAKMLLAFGWPEAVPIYFSAGWTEMPPQSGSENFFVVAPPDPATHLASFSTIQGDNPACEAKKKTRKRERGGGGPLRYVIGLQLGQGLWWISQQLDRWKSNLEVLGPTYVQVKEIMGEIMRNPNNMWFVSPFIIR